MDMNQTLAQVPPGFLSRSRIVICGILIDRSGSMRKFEDAVLQFINAHLTSLKSNERAHETLYVVATFADGVRFDVPPQPLATAPAIDSYRTDGCTLLYGSIQAVLEWMLDLKQQALQQGSEVTLRLDVLTDGIDEPPEHLRGQDFRTPLQALTSHALEAGAELWLYGIGFPCQRIASDIGFPPQNAIQVAATEHGMQETFRKITHLTHITMLGMTEPGSNSSR